MICQSACSSWSQATSVVVEVRVAADQLAEGRHAASLGPGPGRAAVRRRLAG